MMETIGNLLLILGICFILFGSFYILILPNFYARLLACSQIDTLGMITIIIGILMIDFQNINGFKILLILLFTLCINPISTYAIGRSAFLRGELPDKKEGSDE